MRILYICTGNSFRSPAAEALTRRYRAEFEVESAGISPATRIAGNAKELLEEEGAREYLKSVPDSVTWRALEEADRIVVMEEMHREHLTENFEIGEDKLENWEIGDPINPDVDPREAFDQIKDKVRNI